VAQVWRGGAPAGDGIPEASNPAARKRAEKNLFIPPDYF